MGRISLAQFRAFVRAHDGQRFETLERRRPFILHDQPDGVAFALVERGKIRRESWTQLGAVLDHFNEVKSFRPGQYADVTRNSSYILAVLKTLLQE